MKISRANAVHMTSLTKRNITGTTGCQLGLLIPNWTHSDRQLCLSGLNTGVFHFWLLFFPKGTWARPPPASLGARSVLGARRDAGENFYTAKQRSGLQLLKKFPLSAKPFKLPKHFGNYSVYFAANWETCFAALAVRKQKTPSLGKDILSHYYQSAELDSEQSFVVFHLGLPTRALYPKAAQAHFYIFV